MITDKNGIEIKVGHELNVPLEVFSNGIVVLNKDKELSLELRYEDKKIAIKGLNQHLEILN